MNHVLPSSVVHALKDAAEATVHTATDLAHSAYDRLEDSPVAAALPSRRRSTGPSTFVKAAGAFIVVGNKGMKGKGRFLGSVPNDVAHEAPCAVLIVQST